MTISPEVLDKFWSQDWDELYPRLTDHAKGELLKRGWGIDRFPPPDIVNTAINRVLIGKRRWNPDKDPDLPHYLCQVIESLVGHLPRELKRMQKLRDMRDLTEAEAAEAEQAAGSDPDPEELVLQRELEALSEAAFWKLYESCNEDPLVQKILDRIHDGTTKREELAEKIGVPLKDYDNARRRLRDKLAKAYPQVATRAKRR